MREGASRLLVVVRGLSRTHFRPQCNELVAGGAFDATFHCPVTLNERYPKRREAGAAAMLAANLRFDRGAVAK